MSLKKVLKSITAAASLCLVAGVTAGISVPAEAAPAASASAVTTAVQSVGQEVLAAAIVYTPKTGRGGNCNFTNRIYDSSYYYRQMREGSFLTTSGRHGCWVVRREGKRLFDLMWKKTVKKIGGGTYSTTKVAQNVRSFSGFPSLENRRVTLELWMRRPYGKSAWGSIGWAKDTFPVYKTSSAASAFSTSSFAVSAPIYTTARRAVKDDTSNKCTSVRQPGTTRRRSVDLQKMHA